VELVTKTPKTNEASSLDSWALMGLPSKVMPESVMFGVRIGRMLTLHRAISDCDTPWAGIHLTHA